VFFWKWTFCIWATASVRISFTFTFIIRNTKFFFFLYQKLGSRRLILILIFLYYIVFSFLIQLRFSFFMFSLINISKTLVIKVACLCDNKFKSLTNIPQILDGFLVRKITPLLVWWVSLWRSLLIWLRSILVVGQNHFFIQVFVRVFCSSYH